MKILTWIAAIFHLVALAHYTYLALQGTQVSASQVVIWISISLSWIFIVHRSTAEATK